ncbi:hypothetical protein AVEN_96756-1 [Araneus ventricosus]|uniref:Uncharacterized protein n=1 Tax=Araneus ventricosus TaxID=182803 RepID=A0A4Y2KX58_ARAVE|nr:hypothetical protein AVEN_96756-1 [Araneus ventricosus]
MSVDINFEETVTVTVQQEHFLANGRNRTRLIQLLRQKMNSKGIETRVAKGDADIYIVRCGLEKAISHPTVAIIGEDVDLIMILISLAPAESDIYFMKPGKGRPKLKYFQQESFKKNFLLPKPSSLFMHTVAATQHQQFIEKAKRVQLICSKIN